MDNRTPENIAWAAGLFEGEGCITFNRRGLHITVAMTDDDVVDRFNKVIGFGRRRVEAGRHAKDKRGATQPWKSMYWWTITDFEHAQAFVAMVWPYLGERRRTSAAALLKSKRVDLSARARTHCKRGHPLSWMKHGRRRWCLTCHNEADRAYRLRKKARQSSAP